MASKKKKEQVQKGGSPVSGSPGEEELTQKKPATKTRKKAVKAKSKKAATTAKAKRTSAKPKPKNDKPDTTKATKPGASKKTRLKTSKIGGKRKAQVKGSSARAKVTRFIQPSTLSIYDYSPIRKYIEYEYYLVYSGQVAKERRGVIGESSPAKVSARELKKRFNSKTEREAIIAYISKRAIQYFHRDQKILIWDYLRNKGLPDSIDMDYDIIPRKVMFVCFSFNRRRIIEALTTIGQPVGYITDVVNRDPYETPISDEEVECYQHFFWNTEIKHVLDYPIQSLVAYMHNLRHDIEHGNNYVGEKSKALKGKINTKTGKLYTHEEIISEAVKSGDDDMVKAVHAPYINSPGSRDDLIPWSTLSLANTRTRPFSGYGLISLISSGDLTVDQIINRLGIHNVEDLTTYNNLRKLAFLSSSEAINRIGRGEIEEAAYYLSKIGLPATRMLESSEEKLESSEKESELSRKHEIVTSEQADYEEVTTINPAEDEAKVLKKARKVEGELKLLGGSRGDIGSPN